jgi:hypothetical protein
LLNGMDRHDVIVTDRGGGLGFPQKPLAGGGVGGKFGGEDLDGHDAIELRVVGLEHDAHAAPADHLGDLVLTNAPQATGLLGRPEEVESKGLAICLDADRGFVLDRP